jgi:lysozyme
VARTINSACLNLVKSFEGLFLKPYADIVGIPTIGYGATYYEDGTKVKLSDPRISESRALDLLAAHLNEQAHYVEKLVTSPINDNQFGALVSFVFNVGAGNFTKSTLLKRLNSGDMSGAAEEFLKWDKAGGKQVAGLTRRRQAERSLFLQPVASESMLGDGPTDEEIKEKLKNVEDDV